MSLEREFTLPLGYVDAKGLTHRKVRMRMATAMDEIEIQAMDEVRFNDRFRDLLIFSKVILSIGGISPVTPEMLEDLYEADFIYLQLAFSEMNRPGGALFSLTCPACGRSHALSLADAFEAEDAPVSQGAEPAIRGVEGGA
jgi:hypothetical protein